MINFSLSVSFRVTLVYRIIPITVTQSVILGLTALPGNLLEIRTLTIHSRHTKSESIF